VKWTVVGLGIAAGLLLFALLFWFLRRRRARRVAAQSEEKVVDEGVGQQDFRARDAMEYGVVGNKGTRMPVYWK
jgi:hypothetical protein